MKPSLLIATFALVAATVPNGELSAQSPICEWQPGFSISRDSIGPVATTDPLGIVRQQCNARDTIYDGRIPSIAVSVPGGVLVGLQPNRRTIDDSAPARVWYITGDGLLPNDVALDATWAAVKNAYGREALGNAEFPPPGWPEHATVWFEQHPGLFLRMWNLSMEDLHWPNEFELDIDPLSVPDSATIWKVMVRPPGR